MRLIGPLAISLLVSGQPQLHRAGAARSSLLFPGDDDDDPAMYTAQRGSSAAPNTWTKGTLERGGDYWYRESASGEPEISLTDPNDGWQVGVLANGQEYVWKEGTNEDDEPQVELLGSAEEGFGDDEDDGADDFGEWQVGVLPSGREYLWRQVEGTDEPEVRLWFESTLDSGAPFWYDEDGEVSLNNPFEMAARRRGGRSPLS